MEHTPKKARDVLNRIRNNLLKFAIHPGSCMTLLYSKLNSAITLDKGVQIGNLLVRLEVPLNASNTREILLTTTHVHEDSYLSIDHSDAIQLICELAQVPDSLPLAELLNSCGPGRRLEALGILVSAPPTPSAKLAVLTGIADEILEVVRTNPTPDAELDALLGKMRAIINPPQ